MGDVETVGWEKRMKIFGINKTVEHRFKGSGLALAAVRDGELTALTYIGDIAPDFSDRARHLPSILLNQRVLAEISSIAASGAVSAGMCSGERFMVLRDIVAGEHVGQAGSVPFASQMPRFDQTMCPSENACPPVSHGIDQGDGIKFTYI